MSAIRNHVKTAKAPGSQSTIHSQGIVAAGLVYTSGATGRDPITGRLVEGSVEDRTHRCILNLKAILEASGSSLDQVVEVNVYLTDMDMYDRVNKVYQQYWGTSKPARTCIGVSSLPGYTDVEIKCVGLVTKPVFPKL